MARSFSSFSSRLAGLLACTRLLGPDLDTDLIRYMHSIAHSDLVYRGNCKRRVLGGLVRQRGNTDCTNILAVDSGEKYCKESVATRSYLALKRVWQHEAI
jgi:hypothetical protein